MLDASLLQLTPEKTLEIKEAIQAIRAYERDQELKVLLRSNNTIEYLLFAVDW